ncbi:MAG: hypothetical protein KC593_16985 [Myxococcales bacterium]|nr:hypothetical protein [Myxococcales bacterium]MCB9626654.1 hypothetical protein [Sandaracinaceae bacterium]
MPGPTRTQQPSWLLFSFAALVTLVVGGCEGCLKRPPASSVERLPYPSCPGLDELPEGQVLASGHLRSGPDMRDRAVVERWELRERACLRVMTVRQEWPMGISDVEVVFDEHYQPLRVWKRMSMPRPPAGQRAPTPDIRLYELRTSPATLTRTSEDGREYFTFRGGRPVAVVGPGRALLGAWIRQHLDLTVGETVRGPVLDFRRPAERVETVALRREADALMPDVAGGDGHVRVYTVFGRESVFTDDEGNVLGDLAGLRPHARLTTPEPPALPSDEPPDPVGTPSP